jgi:hypothetical protein
MHMHRTDRKGIRERGKRQFFLTASGIMRCTLRFIVGDYRTAAGIFVSDRMNEAQPALVHRDTSVRGLRNVQRRRSRDFNARREREKRKETL